MKVLLISPAMKNNMPPACHKEPPMGLISIATHLTRCGHTVKVVDRLVKVRSIEREIKTFRPDFVGITLMYVKTIKDACRCSKTAKRFGAQVVWGGHLATVIPELILKESFVDFVIMGEGEHTFQDLLNEAEKEINYSKIAGLAYKNDGMIRINTCRELTELSSLPPMDFGFVNPSDYFQSYSFCKRQVHLYTSKGCPGRCAFCHNPFINNSVHRKRPIEHVLEEIRTLVDVHGADGIYFEDEILRTNSKDLAEICAAFRNSGIDFIWGCKMRIGILTPEDFTIMYQSGCRWIFFGVESASEEMCRIMHKGISLSEVQEDIENCAAAGILPTASFIVGLPDETVEQLKQTVTMAKSLTSAVTFCSFLVPYVAAEYYNKLIAKNQIVPAENLSELINYPTSNEYLPNNYSAIPDRDLKVVRAYLLWWSFKVKPTSGDDTGFSLSKKALAETFGNLYVRGIKGVVSETYGVVHMAVSFGFNLFCFPRVKKKYGLTLNRTHK